MAAIEEEEQFQRFCHFLSTYFFVWNHSGVKSISGIKGGYAMWFSSVNCPRGCSSLSCDNNNDKLRCMKLLRLQQRALCHCACLNQI